ncbi:MAG: hypothetical protein A3D92_19645 [Bacteroidetes bacterium RIFCSPHIGHO2_02_FULL_44_7]|nr:MAG: hypothetical protein A3D92_19645 [Bacteroidetes bacterium RIFCSPHIGHO2_02_FULL_44_7]
MMQKSGGKKVLIAGLTFKPDVPDYRNSRVKHLIKELQDYDLTVYGYDPLLEKEIVEKEFGVECVAPNTNVDLVLVAVNHKQLEEMKQQGVFGNTTVVSLRGMHKNG